MDTPIASMDRILKLDLNEERLPAPFSHPSGKTRLRALVIKLMPEHETYCEPFCGMASIFFAKPPSKKEVLNDLDPNYHTILKFLKEGSESDWSRIKERNWRASKERWAELRVSKPQGRLDQVFRSMYILRFAFRGLTGTGNYAASRAMLGWPKSLYDRRDLYRERLKGTAILNQDFETTMKNYDSTSTLFFLDPPYLPGKESVEQGFMGGSKREAEQIITRLAARLRKTRGHWMMTHAEHTQLKGIFSKLGHLRCLTMNEPSSREGESGTRREMIIASFKLPERLRIVYVQKSEDISKMPIEAISPDTLEEEDDTPLLNLHLRLHQLWGNLGSGQSLDSVSREDLANAHFFVVNEMQARGMEHFMHDSLDDSLKHITKEDELWKKYEERAKPAWRIFELGDLDELKGFEDSRSKILVEVKWDGERLQLQKHGKEIEIWSDYPRRIDKRLPSIVRELETMDQTDFILDSEAIMLDSEAKECLHRTMITAHLNAQTDPSEREGNAHCIAFDCLEFDGKDIQGKVLEERLDLLRQFKGTDHIHFITDYLTQDLGKDALAYLVPRDNRQFPQIVKKLMGK